MLPRAMILPPSPIPPQWINAHLQEAVPEKVNKKSRQFNLPSPIPSIRLVVRVLLWSRSVRTPARDLLRGVEAKKPKKKKKSGGNEYGYTGPKDRGLMNAKTLVLGTEGARMHGKGS